MRAKTVEKVMKNSIVYGCAVTQPFLLYVDIQPSMHDTLLEETEVLKYGENSEIVRHLQHKLSKTGYYEDGLDGTFGLLTEHAVKGFQSSHHIKVTGQVDQQTMKQLIYEEKKQQIKEIESEIENIYFGAENDDVILVQEVLLYYGYYQGEVDGIYGPLTEEAIQKVKDDQLLVDEEEEQEAENEVEASANDENNQEKTKEKEEEVISLETEENNTNVIQDAKSLMGTPYVWGGTSQSGFDCSGFIQFVYEENDITIPRTVNEIWNFANPIDTPSIGDLVFFETYQKGPSHLGIYLGNSEFIHAGTSNGVQISNMNEDYWQSRYLGAKRIQ